MTSAPLRRALSTLLTLSSAAALLVSGASSGLGRWPEARDLRAKPRIVGGKPDTGDPAVAALFVEFSSGDAYICSGTVLGPHTFVTAGHCTVLVVQALGDGGFVHPGEAFVVVGPDVNTGATFLVDAALTYPTYNGINSLGDIGMVHTGVAIQVFDGGFGEYPPLNRIPLERVPLFGNNVRQIGYGETGPSSNDEGIKREVNISDVKVQSSTEIAESGSGGDTCEGDSGGPTLFQFPDGVWWEIAVTSKGSTQCNAAASDTRVDAYASFINDFMAAHDDVASCNFDGGNGGMDGRCAIGCASPDPDCPCALDGFCGACPDPSQDPDCPESCYFDGGTCGAPKPPVQPVGSPPKNGCGAFGGGADLAALGLVVAAIARRRRR